MMRAEQRYQRRKDVVEAVQRGEPPGLVARVFRIPQRTVFAWLARYRAQGWVGLQEGTRSGRPRKVTGEVMRWLYDAITLGNPQQYQLPFCLWTLKLIRQLLKRHHGIVLSKSSTCRLLGQLGLSPQKPVYRSYKQRPEELHAYLHETFPTLKQQAKRLGAEIYFVDESAVRADHHRGTTWAPIGQTPVVRDSGDRFGIKLISAVSPRGDMRFAVIAGRMNSAKFLDFLKKLHRDARRPIIVIADRATYHVSGATRQFVEQTDGAITLDYLPRYAPELNPDEQVWNHAKARLGKTLLESQAHMKRVALNVLRSIQRTTSLVRSFFQLEMTKYAADAYDVAA